MQVFEQLEEHARRRVLQPHRAKEPVRRRGDGDGAARLVGADELGPARRAVAGGGEVANDLERNACGLAGFLRADDHRVVGLCGVGGGGELRALCRLGLAHRDGVAHGLRQAGKEYLIVREGDRLLDPPRRHPGIGRPVKEPGNQRVAIGRAIVRDPKVFLLDEPLSNLDARLRLETRAELKRLHRKLGTTTIYVTHDQEEAMTLGDRVAVMKDGVMQQVGTPLEVYRAPANLFVAGFIGPPAMNLMQGEAKDGQATLASGFQVSLPTSLDGPITVGVRPQHFRVATDNDQGAVELKARLVEPLGDLADVHLEAADGSTLLARLDAEWAPAEGATCPIVIDRDRHHCFDSAGQRAN